MASHVRRQTPGGFSTDPTHMPERHQRYLEWTPERIVRWGQQLGPATAEVTQAILAACSHPEHGFRSCLGIFSLGRRYGIDRLEAACQRALSIGSPRYRSVQSILKNGIDRQTTLDAMTELPPRDHANLRGAGYYH